MASELVMPRLPLSPHGSHLRQEQGSDENNAAPCLQHEERVISGRAHFEP